MIYTKRAYQKVSEDDGVRVLVDRIWPRGLSKKSLAINFWCKDIAPSTELRQWFSHDPEKFAVFKQKYIDEIQTDSHKNEKWKELKKVVELNKHVTLIYAAKDEQYNQAVILKELLGEQLKNQ